MPIIVISSTPPSTPTYPSDGALFAGVESTFQYNGLTINDRTLENKYRVTSIGGLGGADIRDSREIRSGRDGERTHRAFYGGRTITLSGRIESLNDHLHGLRVMTTALSGAFADLSEKPLFINQGNLGGWDTQISCRPGQPVALTEEIKTWYHYRDFLITLRASDPRIVSQQQMAQTWVANATSVLGESIFVHQNLGNYKADLNVTLRGPMTNPTWVLGDTAFSFINGTVIGAGQEWTINTGTGTVTDLAGVNKFASVALTSIMPYYIPGPNSFLFNATGLTVGTSQITVAYRHSWI